MLSSLKLSADGFQFPPPVLRMHPDDQHFLVIGTIEDADPPAFRQMTGRAPEKIMFQLLGARLFETENLVALRIDP